MHIELNGHAQVGKLEIFMRAGHVKNAQKRQFSEESVRKSISVFRPGGQSGC